MNKQVTVHNYETKESNDWLDVVDIDMELHLGIIVSNLLSPPWHVNSLFIVYFEWN